MKQRIAMILAGTTALAAIAYSQYRKTDVEVSSVPLFHLIGDTEQELTHLPVRMTRLSDEEEMQIGNELANLYVPRLQEEPKNDRTFREAQSYVEQVGSRVASHARRKLPYKFHYIPDDSFVNAFSLPGGHVFIGQGLLQLMDSEDELSAVLGHEVEHIDLGHCAERVQMEARLRRLHLGAAGGLAQLPFELFAAGYSKEQEFAADSDGTALAVASGYSPTGAIRMFEAFAKFESQQAKASTPHEEISRVASQSLSEYFHTHPLSQERAQRVKQLMASNGWPAMSERDLRLAYIGLNSSAAGALAQYQYQRAIGNASRSIKIKPDQIRPYEILYQASMYTGDFTSATEAARRMVSSDPDSENYAQEYASALAASGAGKDGAKEFSSWSHEKPRSPEIQIAFNVEAAGLELLIGNEKPIQSIVDRLKMTEADHPQDGWTAMPKQAGMVLRRVARWYYLTGRYDRAFDYFGQAQELLPDQPGIGADIGWTALQLNKIASAESAFQLYSTVSDTHAGLAVAFWMTDNHDRAIREYAALSEDPKWQNGKWVSATYGQSTFARLEAIRAEANRRSHVARSRN